MEPIQQTNSKTGIYVTVAVILIIIIALVVFNKKNDVDDNIVVNPTDSTVVTPPETTSPAGSTTTGPGIDPQREGLSTSNAGVYANLMLKYKDRMVQFNKECAVVSNKVGFKQGYALQVVRYYQVRLYPHISHSIIASVLV